MSEILMVSPLLDGYTVEKTVMTQRDRTWYSVRHTESGECFVLKHLSVPASDAQVRALILSGIYENEQDVLAYYTGLVSDMKRELDLGKNLSETGCFAGPVDYQIVQKTDGIGYDIYILQALQVPLNELINRNGMTHLRAINLGIDLCDAIIACREAGYLFANLKPDNIFLVPSGRFMLGDLGLVPLQDLQYAGIPEDYIGSFSPPELFDITGVPNLTLDLYSLGMVLYRIYNGNHGPFEDENTDEAMADKLRLSGKPLPTPIYADYELAGIITKACSYRIPGRYSTPEQLKEALLLYLQRNQIPDSLIVPPLVVSQEPVVEEEAEATEETPLRMVDAAELDEAFRESFAPNADNKGTDVLPEVAIKMPETSVNESDVPAKDADVPVVASSETPTEVESTPSQEETPATVATESPDTVADAAEPIVQAPAEETIPLTQEADISATVEIEPSTAEESKQEEPATNVETPQPEEIQEQESPQDSPAPSEPSPASAENAPATEEPEEQNAPEAVQASEGKPTEEKEDLLSANAVSGPKMPTGNLRMNKKHRSRRRKNLVLEIPEDPEEVTVKIDSPSSDSEKTFSIHDEPTIAAKPSESDLSHKEEKQDIDIDQLIASVNEVVGVDVPTEASDKDNDEFSDSNPLTMHIAPRRSGYYDSYAEDSNEDSAEEDSREKKKSKWLPITIIAILAVAIIGVVAFLLNNYYVDITELKLLDHSTDSLTVELITPDPQEYFIVTCTDNYGNSYPRVISGTTYVFNGLRENTAYTVTVIASEYHRLSSGKSYSITVKTPGSTKITEFTARRGTQDGDVVLNFTSEGPSPEEWQYTYTDESGVICGPFSFTNQTALVTDLVEGVNYTFTIQGPRDLYLSGTTTVEYTLLPIISVTSLRVMDVSDNTVSIAWDCEENIPSEWSVTCEGGDYSKTVVTSDFNITFAELPDLNREYTFYVNAIGMEEPAELILPADPIILEDLKAEYQEDGTVKVTWNTPAGVPAGGWHLTYNTVGSLHVPYLLGAGSEDISTNSATLRGLIPNAEYVITLHLTADDASMTLFGENTTTLTTPVAETFKGYDIDPLPVFNDQSLNLSLWLCPEKEDWTYNDLQKTRTEFTKDERIAVCLQVESISASEDTVTLLYVLRNEEGQVVTDESNEFTWDSLWFERRHANEVPLPKAVGENTSVPGKYTLEVYINGCLLLQRDFTIV